MLRIDNGIKTVDYVRAPNSCAEDRCPTWKTDNKTRPAFWARMSVEAIVVVLVAAATIGIFTVQILAGGWEDSDSPGPSRVVGFRHSAISEAPPSDADRASPPNAQHSSSAVLEAEQVSDGNRASTNETIVRNGVTILSPPLLVPVINADTIQIANGSETVTSPRKASSARKRSHYANRAPTRGQRRVARSAPFWRVVAR